MTADPAGPVLCVLPWIHLCASIDGVYGRCCVDGSMYYEQLYEQEEEPAFTLREDSIGCAPRSRFAKDNPERVMGLTEAFNSPGMRRTRLAMLEGERVSACEYCYKREARGAQSYRQDVNRRFADSIDLADLAARTAADGSVEDFPFFLDIRFGNTCNLRCVMCTFPVSSGWGAVRHPSWSSAVIDAYREDERLWTELAANAHLIRRLYFAGGEPFLQPGHFRLLDLLIETGNAQNVDIVYNSNMTILPEDVFARFRRFKSVGIGASCDGTGEVFERIRTGARWPVFVRNVRRAKPEVDVWLQVAAQRDNIWGLRDLLAFGAAEGLEVDMTNILQWPAEMSVANLPPEEKLRATAELTDLLEQAAADGRHAVAEQLAALRTYMNSPDAA